MPAPGRFASHKNSRQPKNRWLHGDDTTDDSRRRLLRSTRLWLGGSSLRRTYVRSQLTPLQKDWPRDADHVEQVLWPSLSKYAEETFDAIADTRLKTLGNKFSVRRYLHWLRCTCIPAVVSDVCNGIRLHDTAKHIHDVIGEARWPREVDETRRAVARLMTEVLGGPHSRSIERRVRTVLTARIARWEAAALGKQSTAAPIHLSGVIAGERQSVTENETPPTAPAPPPPPIPCQRERVVDKLSRRKLVDDFLARCNEISAVRIFRAHIWRFIGHRYARQFEYWQTGDDCPPGTTRGATEQDDQNIRRVLSTRPEESLSQLEQRKLVSAKS
jgi:hypothetical protein